MGKTIFAVAALLLVSAASGQDQGLITCWYNPSGAYTGSDGAQPGAQVGVVVNTGSNDDYAFSYTIQAADGNSCPKTLPK